MSDSLVIADGRPIPLRGDGEIGTGPWSRLLASAIVPEPRSARAQRGRELAADGGVHTISIGTGHLSAKVTGSEDRDYDVTLTTRPLPPRVWAAVTGREPDGVSSGKEQSVRLEHELAAGWGEPLVPHGRDVRRSCTCPDIEFSGTCKHVVALAYVFAEAVDDDPSLLLRWRGVGPATDEVERAAPEPVAEPVTRVDDDAWAAGDVPVIEPPRPLPVAAVLKRLGPSGVKLDGVELIDLLEPAYAALASGERHR